MRYETIRTSSINTRPNTNTKGWKKIADPKRKISSRHNIMDVEKKTGLIEISLMYLCKSAPYLSRFITPCQERFTLTIHHVKVALFIIRIRNSRSDRDRQPITAEDLTIVNARPERINKPAGQSENMPENVDKCRRFSKCRTKSRDD